MSGFEVAGVVLGALPLVINALSAYRQNRGKIAVWRRFRGLLDDLLHQLKTQKTNFYLDILELLREARVPAVLEELDPNEDKCVEILQHARTGTHVEDYLGHLWEPFLEILGYYEKYLKDIVSGLNNLARPENVGFNNPVWAKMRFSMDKESLDALVEDLSTERYSLGNLIKRVKSKREWEAREPTGTSATLALTFAKVTKSATMLYKAACKCWACDQHGLHTVLLRLDHRIREDSNMRGRRGREALIAFGLCLPIEEDVLQEIEVAARSLDHSHAFVTSQPRSTAIGSLSVPTITVTTLQESSPSHNRVQRICHNAQRARRLGRILSLILTSDALELSEEDKPHQPYSHSTTLAEFLRNTAQDEDARMGPILQTLLALNVVSSVLQLRPTAWCNTPWTSKTIKFPTKTNNGSPITICTPYVEQTFDTTMLQCHDCTSGLNTQAIKSTMLELAILLLEILHHRSLESWAEKHEQGDMCSYGERMLGANRWLEMSTGRLLPDHLKAVEGCLEYCVKSNLAWDKSFQSGYCENVIKPLQQLTSIC
ncbi:uncharacterized protein NECHADRAFT_76039 [Fusarium vanettenii 77-13-4]|uniref:DUF7580 domain-containing protein n=1 Tax=Fusarium vanettenii (strain ATCC MYA-4622 / CBS 123669 / FGSC 9596 / NRRL 45880 / 77-13-4) TaxID=660122 RepID=C7Z6B0_FUSV7|nr:uncharacterized protein NECHADRAFT_76039 [Fusarium vanettenii 77-13-4]EEU40664.1 predicted protein [Fusarium vanettenii 77-13-4]